MVENAGQTVEKIRLHLYDSPVTIENVTGEKPPICAFLGPSGTYTEQAVLELLDGQVDLQPVERIAEVIRLADQGKTDLGLVPVENSTEGGVLETVKELIHARSGMVILGERVLPIHHALLGQKDARKKGVVHSHPQAIGQCSKWLTKHLPEAKIVRHNSTAEAVQMASEKGELAIGSIRAGELYRMPTLAEGIEDLKGNTTRFWLLGRGETPLTGEDRTAVVFSLRQGVGLIRNALGAFADRRISIQRIDSFPMGALDQYYFFLTCDGHVKQDGVSEAIKDLESRCLKVKVLGSYHKSPVAEKFFEPDALKNGWAVAEDIDAV